MACMAEETILRSRKSICEQYSFITSMKNYDEDDRYMIKISIIIPVWNVELYLSECLDSMLKQTLQEIEVICIDDCSEDRSLSILMQYAEMDKRIKVVSFNKNQSASIARKIGIILAKGKYIMFADADDSLEICACHYLYDKIERNKVDILQFGTNIINCANLSEARIKSNQKFLAPYLKQLKDKEVFEGCFIEQKYQFSLWNKIYNAEVVKKASEYMEDIPLPKAQDKYAFFIISYFAKSYLGIAEPFYNYKFGRGITGHNKLSLEQFKKYCRMGETADAIQRFLIKVEAIEIYSNLYEKVRLQLLNDCIGNWQKLEESEQAEGFDLVLMYFEKAEIIAAIAKLYWWSNGDIAERISNSNSILMVSAL